jgi:hypothetical protein
LGVVAARGLLFTAFVGGSGVAVGVTGVAVGSGVFVGGTDVAEGGTDVAVGMGVAEGGANVAVGSSSGACVPVGAKTDVAAFPSQAASARQTHSAKTTNR